MKTLFLTRHGKSSWKDIDIPDAQRPLKKSGKKETAKAAHHLKKADLLPQLILCSSALRAKETAEIFIAESGFKGKVEYLDTLYMAEPEQILASIKQYGQDTKRIMVIGHNPGLETALQLFTHDVVSLPTASIAQIRFSVDDWHDVNGASHGELVELWRPKPAD